jgi:hypothetical protein
MVGVIMPTSSIPAPPSAPVAPSAPASPSAPVSPVPRRITGPRWNDSRLWAGVVLVVIAVLLGIRAVRTARAPSVAVWSTTRAVAVGTVLSSADVHVVTLRKGPGSDRYLPASVAVIGVPLGRALGADELMPRTALTALAPTETVSVVLGADNSPVLTRGEHVQLWVTTRSCRGVVVLGDVVVQSVQLATASATGSGGGQSVTLQVSDDWATRIATAAALTGAVLQAGILRGQDVAAPPADLSTCVGTR